MTERVSRAAHSPHKKPKRHRRALTYAALGFWAIVCLFPLYWVAVTSLKGGPEIVNGPFYLPFVDFRPTLEAWAYVLADPNDNLRGRYFNSAIVALTSTLLTLLIGGLAVYGLTRFRFSIPWRTVLLGLVLAILATAALFVPAIAFPALPVLAIVLLVLPPTGFFRRGPAMGSRGALIAILATRILPPVVVVLPIYLMAQHTGTLDTRFALVFAYTAANLPLAVWLLHAVFGQGATDQEEAAQLDGASHIRIFSEIFVPMVATSVAAVGLLTFILCWNEYLLAAYLTGDHAMTLPPWMVGQMSMKEAQVGGDQEEWSRLSVAMVLMILPLLVFASLAQRFVSNFAVRRRAT